MPQINHHRELTRPCYDSGPVEIHGKLSEELISSQKKALGNSGPACSLLVRSAGFCWLAGPKVCTQFTHKFAGEFSILSALLKRDKEVFFSLQI